MLPPEELARIEACARSPFRAVRLFALERLGSEGHPRLGELLLRLLQDPDLAVRLEAVRVAGVSGCRDALPVLLDLLNCADETVALQAAVSLGELGYYGELGSQTLVPSTEASAQPPRMTETTFYLLFVILSAGLFLSGYLFHAQLDSNESPAAESVTHP
jgi:HEAT repeat protein